jgi:Ca2+-binding EF-hand superfamily protein
MLTKFQKLKLPKLFALHDLNRDGIISRADFEEYARRIARTRGWGPDSAEYNALLGRFLNFWNGLEQIAESRGSLNVTLTEWYAYWDRILGTPGMYELIAAPIGRMVFTMLDHDGDGSVTGDEYAVVYKHGGLDPDEAPAAFTRLDLDHDGRLSVAEVMTLLDQFFRSEDPAEPGNAFFGVAPVMVG